MIDSERSRGNRYMAEILLLSIRAFVVGILVFLVNESLNLKTLLTRFHCTYNECVQVLEEISSLPSSAWSQGSYITSWGLLLTSSMVPHRSPF